MTGALSKQFFTAPCRLMQLLLEMMKLSLLLVKVLEIQQTNHQHKTNRGKGMTLPSVQIMKGRVVSMLMIR